MTNEEALEVVRRFYTVALHDWDDITNKEQEDDATGLYIALKALEKQIPKKPYIDNENGVYEKEYCPTCHRSLFPNDHHCRCGQRLDWRD